VCPSSFILTFVPSPSLLTFPLPFLPSPRDANQTPSLSIGGGFVNTIACAPVGGNFAAFAAGSGSFYTDNGGVTGGGVTGQVRLSQRRTDERNSYL
jgi:hypothetical protein